MNNKEHFSVLQKVFFVIFKEYFSVLQKVFLVCKTGRTFSTSSCPPPHSPSQTSISCNNGKSISKKNAKKLWDQWTMIKALKEGKHTGWFKCLIPVYSYIWQIRNFRIFFSGNPLELLWKASSASVNLKIKNSIQWSIFLTNAASAKTIWDQSFKNILKLWKLSEYFF